MARLVYWLRANWLIVLLAAGLALTFIFLRTQPTAGLNSLQDLEASLGTGRPVVLEFYSNF
jgi:hypothetical protein